jgi:hypothetical protein
MEPQHLQTPRPPEPSTGVRHYFPMHPCAACGAPTVSPWFCRDCQARARQHIDDDPYDELGGEGE